MSEKARAVLIDGDKHMTKRRVLILAEQCNPEWPSLPIVGFNYARALAEVADVTVVTHVRNRENIQKIENLNVDFVYIDNEWIAKPLHNFAIWMRGGDEVAWSTNMIFAYPPYVAFEVQAWRRFKRQINAGDFDLIHRVTPMSPTMPSYIAGKGNVPFVLGPLNGNLDWPKAFKPEQKREKEGLRKVRNLYKMLPFARTTQRNSSCILAGFEHTINDLDQADPKRVLNFPEIGIDPKVFPRTRSVAAFAHDGPYKFLFAGRLVPYKLSEAAVRAFVTSSTLRNHQLNVIGDGPELARLEEIVREHGAEDCVNFTGRQSQSTVAEAMRMSDAFVFPSIRELGAGVVVEAMASGCLLIVTDYGAPGELVANGRGVSLPLAALDELVDGYRNAMETCLAEPSKSAQIAVKGQNYTHETYTWQAKARSTAAIYDSILKNEDLSAFDTFD